ncbi:CHAD domain-containing protein [Planctomicrobium sp. SH661]|uniref:CHAD domain-containing protein n=1 Tax=Planctomicrobium sp. SH661 TaxID=3448124 RepID=UPI003F5C7EA4
MPYAFRRSESVQEGLRRIACDQLRIAVASLSETIEDQLEGIHEARKCIKKLRAVLRLLPSGDRSWAGRVDGEVKSVAHTLAEVRDQDALRQALGRVQKSSRPEGDAALFEDALSRLEHAGLHPGVALEQFQQHRPGIVLKLEQLVGVVEAAEISPISPRKVLKNIAKRYCRGRDRFRSLTEDSDPEAMHEWRKCSKDYWYHLRLLKKVWPECMTPMIQASSELCDLLGEDRDLGLLAEAFGDEEKLQPLTKLIKRHQHRARKRALQLGTLIFAEKKSALKRRLHCYWDSWKSVDDE